MSTLPHLLVQVGFGGRLKAPNQPYGHLEGTGGPCSPSSQPSVPLAPILELQGLPGSKMMGI